MALVVLPDVAPSSPFSSQVRGRRPSQEDVADEADALIPRDAFEGHGDCSHVEIQRRVPSLVQKCSFLCPLLDSFLGGGVPCRLVTELVGESASGKSQLCLQLLLSSQLPHEFGGLAGPSLCIYTEGRFPLKRLFRMAGSGRFAAFSQQSGHHLEQADPAKALCEEVFIKEIQDGPLLVEFLHTQVLHILSNPPGGVPFRLIVIDSIAAVFRSDFDNTCEDMSLRSQAMFELSRCLRLLAEQFDLAVVVTNHVVASVNDLDQGPQALAETQTGCTLITSQQRVVPALGLAWSSCVGMRLFLSRSLQPITGGRLPPVCSGPEYSFDKDETFQQPVQTIRSIEVVHSPYLDQRSCLFELQDSGLHGVDSCHHEE